MSSTSGRFSREALCSRVGFGCSPSTCCIKNTRAHLPEFHVKRPTLWHFEDAANPQFDRSGGDPAYTRPIRRVSDGRLVRPIVTGVHP